LQNFAFLADELFASQNSRDKMLSGRPPGNPDATRPQTNGWNATNAILLLLLIPFFDNQWKTAYEMEEGIPLLSLSHSFSFRRQSISFHSVRP
jgi:hypothetical protein